MATIIDGKALAQKIRAEVKSGAAKLKLERNIIPGLATILVGEDPASQVYVRHKNSACAEAGMVSKHEHLSADIGEAELLAKVCVLNEDPTIHGILVQLPLPRQINPDKVIATIDPKKDVDGFHPVNMGKLMIGQAGLQPCTPLGVMRLLEALNYDLTGKQAVVIGRSNIVGKPVALMLLAKHATVTLCHSRTKNIADVVRCADVVVAAVGQAKFVRGDWIKQGAVVIDVGINRNDAGQLVGDVDFVEAVKHAVAITPVPGGVGPMTIAMLLANTLTAATTKFHQ